MSFAMLLGGWIAVSVLLSPLIGRLLAGVDKSPARPGTTADKALTSSRARPRRAETMRRNVAIPLSRRQAGWPRAI